MARSTAQDYEEKGRKKKYDKEYWLSYTKEKFDESRNWRGNNVELQWFVNYMYYKGNQNLKYDKVTGTFIKDIRNPLTFYINHTYMVCRAVRNAVMKANPTWDVDALPYGELDNDTSRILGEYLAFQYDRLNLEEKANKALLYGLLYGLGIFQYGYDDRLDNGEGNAWIETLDPFDTYIDPYCTSMEDARYVIKVMSKPYELLVDNPNYDKKVVENLTTTSNLSESDYKNLILNNENNISNTSKNVILHEGWFVTKEGIRVITTSPQSNEILRNELTTFKKLPFEIYQPDINVGSIYGEGWVKNIVPLNKAANYLETSRLEYNILINKGRLLIPKGAGVKSVTNQNGEKIYYKAGFKPEFLPTPPMGSDVDRQINALGTYIQLIGAANEAFIGQTPTGVKSGIAIETLIASNFNQLSDLVNNLANTLAKLGEDILNLGYEYQLLTKPFRASSGEYYGILGGGLEPKEMERLMKVVSIPANPEVKVKITSGVAHTKEAKRDILMTLRAGGDVSRQTLLENLGIDPKVEQERIVQEQTPQGLPQGMPEGLEGIDPNAPLPEGIELQV
jgi:hypothetical protein